MLLFSFLQDIPSIPNITDWLQGIGTILGVPGAIAAFILLFRKDKEKEKQLEMLTNMVIELNNQTKQFEYQTSLMRDSNEILKEQLQIQIEVMVGDKDYKEKMKIIELKKIKSLSRPYFTWNGGSGVGSKFELIILNIGETAKILSFDSLKENKISNLPDTPLIVERNKTFLLSGKYLDKENGYKDQMIVRIQFEDSIGTNYEQDFNFKGSILKISDANEILN